MKRVVQGHLKFLRGGFWEDFMPNCRVCGGRTMVCFSSIENYGPTCSEDCHLIACEMLSFVSLLRAMELEDRRFGLRVALWSVACFLVIVFFIWRFQ